MWDPAAATAIANAITGIPYSNYEIIAYANDTNGGAKMNMWWTAAPPAAMPRTRPPGTNVYFGATVNTSTGYLSSFVPITNTTAGTYPAGNYTVWTGLTGSSQTIWLKNDGGDGNVGITGFEIVSTAGPAIVNLPATAISATSSSTLDFGETAPASHYHTLGGLSLTAGTGYPLVGGGTQLRLQNGLNINFNGISAICAAGGTGAATTSIAAGSGASVRVTDDQPGRRFQRLRRPECDPHHRFDDRRSAHRRHRPGQDRRWHACPRGSNTYTGGTTISSGALEAANGNTGSATGSSQVTLNGGTLAAGDRRRLDQRAGPGRQRRGHHRAGLWPDERLRHPEPQWRIDHLGQHHAELRSGHDQDGQHLSGRPAEAQRRADRRRQHGHRVLDHAGRGRLPPDRHQRGHANGIGQFRAPLRPTLDQRRPQLYRPGRPGIQRLGKLGRDDKFLEHGRQLARRKQRHRRAGHGSQLRDRHGFLQRLGDNGRKPDGHRPNLKSLSFSNSNYTLSNSTLTLQSSGTATVTVSSGTQQINSAGLALAGKTLVTLNGGSELTLAGNVSGDRAAGPGRRQHGQAGPQRQRHLRRRHDDQRRRARGAARSMRSPATRP